MPKINIDFETLDAITLIGLQGQLKSCKYILKIASNPTDIRDYTEYIKALKLLVKYYGG